MVLISLLARYFYDNIITVKYPNHVICVSKRDTLNFKDMNVPSSLKVKLICSSVDLSNLESLSKQTIMCNMIFLNTFMMFSFL